MENVNDMISKIDKDIQKTKNLIGTKRSSSNLFNISAELSQYDISINNISSQMSVHSTPRIVKPVTAAAIDLINFPVQIGGGDKVI